MKEDKLSILFDKICNFLHLKFKDKTKNLLLQMFKFLLVGGLAFVIDYVTLIICNKKKKGKQNEQSKKKKNRICY